MAKQYLRMQPQAAEAELLKLAKIVERLRHYSKQWQEHFGSGNKALMQDWEQKADEWIKKNIITSNEN